MRTELFLCPPALQMGVICCVNSAFGDSSKQWEKLFHGIVDYSHVHLAETTSGHSLEFPHPPVWKKVMFPFSYCSKMTMLLLFLDVVAQNNNQKM